MDNHQMRYLGFRTNYHEFVCDECGRHVLFHSNPTNADEGQKTFVVLNTGDFNIPHSGSVGGLVIDGVEILEDELLDVWREGLEDVL